MSIWENIVTFVNRIDIPAMISGVPAALSRIDVPALISGVPATLSRIDPLTWWIIGFVVAGLLAGIFSGYFMARKIQPKGFKWKYFRREMMWAVVSLTISATLITFLTGWLKTNGYIQFNHQPTQWWVIVGEYALSFFLFDTYFYWLHRLMHIEPFYMLIHKVHHGSISPNPLTTLSVSPVESIINGGYVPLFLTLMTVSGFAIHDATFALIAPTNIIMGFYVHTGFEFLPSWWNKSWLTKWFITTTFHDQHHRFYKGNYGGYTTIWDRLCGTMRPHYEDDFVKVTTRPIQTAKVQPAE